MIIKRLELVNYCQHEHRVIDISGSLIAVVGHNGCGKSNMLGALQFALTGEQPGKNKADLLHWGAKEGHVVLEFVQDGKTGRIERSVSGPKVTLEYDGVTTSGITAVAKEMDERLHMDKDLVRQSVFVRQSEVDTIISAKTDKRDREVAFQKLLGIDAAKIHKNLTDWMYQAVKPLNYDVQITDAVSRLGALETRKAELYAECEKADLALSEAGSTEEPVDEGLQQSIALITSVIRAQSEAETCAKAVSDRKATLVNITEEAGGGENPGVDLVTKAEEIAVLKEEHRKAQAYENARADLERAEKNLAFVKEKPHPSEEDVEAVRKAYTEKESELAVARHEVATREKALSSLNGTESACPVCGKPLDAGTVAHLTNELGTWRVREANLTGEWTALSSERTTKEDALAFWTRDFSSRQAAYDQAKAAFDGLPAPALSRETAEAELNKAQQQWLDQKTYDNRVARHKQAIADAELRLKVAQKAADEANERLLAASTRACELLGVKPTDNVDWTEALASKKELTRAAEARREKIVALRMALTKAKAARDENDKTLASMAETVEQLKVKQLEQDALAKRLGVIERVRDWFSYQNGPRVLVQQVLAALTDDVNRFLGNFTAPFIVTPDQEQLGFRVQFTDGRDRPADPPGTDVLSGGERVQLAVAFRLAIYGMFAGKLGLLSLDEPTAYLDDGNVDRFGILLGKVRELARNMGTQVFMATHERAVIPHMDSVIDLN